MRRLATAVLISWFCAGVPAGAADVVGVGRAIDGDTLTVGGVVVRLAGIDAPEMGQPCRDGEGVAYDCGRTARDRLADLVDGLPLACRGEDTDRYGRRLAVCRSGGEDVGRRLVAEGLARAFLHFSDRYAAEEAAARRRELGLWAGAAEAPWDYRARHWRVAEAEAPGRCPIKGNVTRDGERVYHAPWSPWYARTRVEPAKGERWFCDEAEALAAGWRAPHWTR